MVVVEHGKTDGFGRSCDEEVSDLRSAVVASLGEAVLDGNRRVQYLLVHRDEGPCASLLPHGFVVGGTGGGVPGLQVGDRAATYQPGLEERIQALGYFRPAGQGGRIAEAVRT